MKRLLLLAAAIMAVTACGASGTSSNGTSGGGGANSSAASPSADVSVGTTSLGATLVDKTGKTLYYFTPEKGGTLVCTTDPCASTWPLLTITGTPTGGQGVTGQLNVVMTADGKSAVTYNGWPLHTYANDSAPGDVNGQGVAGKWYAATPSLSAAGSGGASAAPSASGTYNPY